MAAGDHATIIALVESTIEAITPYAVSGTPAPTVFRKSEGPSMGAAQSRQFDVMIASFTRRNDTGVNSTTAFVERAMDFEVRVLFSHGHDALTDFAVVVFEDVRRIQDKVVRAVREAGGGTYACWCPDPARPESGPAEMSIFVTIPFHVQWNENEYVSGA